MTPLPPGSTIGILGGGQLGRMIAIAAAQIGYRTHVFAPDESGPAFDVASNWTHAAYDDAVALGRFARQVDVVTYEFENVPVGTIRRLAAAKPVRPGAASLEVAQDRLAEKTFVAGLGGRPACYAAVDSLADLERAIVTIGVPAILKTRRLGYDGKGQARIADPAEAAAAWDEIGAQPAVLEGFVAFEREFSLILARGSDGAIARWDIPENSHRAGVLDISKVPASPDVLAQAEAASELAERVVAALDHVGVLTLEFFATGDGPVFNEMAPRVHNSGHWTIEGAATSQFENHVRAIVGLPLGSTALTAPAIEMTNLIGEDADAWPALFAEPGAHVHLYGKSIREGRKMGHVTRLSRASASRTGAD